MAAGAPRLKHPIPAQMQPYEYRTRGGAGESAQTRRSALTTTDATAATVAAPVRIEPQPKPEKMRGTKTTPATHCGQHERTRGTDSGLGYLAHKLKLGTPDWGPASRVSGGPCSQFGPTVTHQTQSK